MFRRVLFVLLVLSGVSSSAAAQTWEINPTSANVTFAVRHLMISTVRGQFEKLSGNVEFDGKDLKTIKANVVIDVASLNTHSAPRDVDLRGPRFFNVEKYPTITYVSKRVEPIGPGTFRLIGDLTIHGVTKEVPLVIEGPSTPVLDKGFSVIGASATTTIDRRDFNLLYDERFDGGGAIVGDEVKISIEIELKRKPTT